jgi:hypothetical protein
LEGVVSLQYCLGSKQFLQKTTIITSSSVFAQNLDKVLDKWVESHRQAIDCIVERGDISALDSMDVLLESELQAEHLAAGVGRKKKLMPSWMLKHLF